MLCAHCNPERTQHVFLVSHDLLSPPLGIFVMFAIFNFQRAAKNLPPPKAGSSGGDSDTETDNSDTDDDDYDDDDDEWTIDSCSDEWHDVSVR